MDPPFQLLALTDEVYGAILSHSGPLGRMLDMVVALKGPMGSLETMNADIDALREIHLQSFEWEAA